MCLLHYIAGAFNHQPDELREGLSRNASDLVKRAFDDIDPAAKILARPVIAQNFIDEQFGRGQYSPHREGS